MNSLPGSQAATRAVAALLLTCLHAPFVRTAGAQDDSDWPRWRGASFDGTSAGKGVFPDGGFSLKVRWRHAFGSGYSGVVASGDHVVTMFSDGVRDYVACLDADSGREHWRLPLAPTYPGREGSNDGPVSTPAIDSNVVYALGPRGDLVAVDLDTGEAIWKKPLVEELKAAVPHWGVSTSPLVVRDWLVVETGGAEGAITAFEKRTGRIAWRAGSDEVNYQSPILWTLFGEEQIVASGDSTLFGLDVTDGRERWRFEHGGSGFYRRIVNPVLIGPGELLLTNGQMESRAISLAKRSGVLEVEPRWTSRHLKLNYATPIFFQGRVYGYSGGFLSCVDALTGELIWRSRPPGNGFPILVDGHLVVLTKKGTLHVAPASPDGYHELASLEVLSRVTWTPPSFARGRIYARDSFAEVVAVDVVRDGAGVTTTAAPRGSIDGLIPGTRFARWLATLDGAEDKEERIRTYLAEQDRFPIVEDEKWAHVVYHGSVRDIALRGGMLGAKTELTLHRVAGTDFYYASFELPPDARVQYQLVRDLEQSLVDPLNPRVSGSLVYPGEVSLLTMPLSERGPEARSRALGVGRIESLPFATEQVQVGGLSWGGTRSVEVYLPHGYDGSDEKRYPSLYVLYGEEMLREARWGAVLDALIGEGEIDPLIAVFVASTSAYEYARSLRNRHADLIVNDLVPLVDGKYRTVAGPSARAIVGVDEGGFGALELAFLHASVFGKVAAQSVLAIGSGGDELLRLIDRSPRLPLDLYLDWGRFDHSNDATETDIPGYGRRLRALLLERGYSVSGREWNDSSDLLIWSLRAPHLLGALFSTGRGSVP